MTRTLTIELGRRRYPIRIGAGLLGAADSYPELRGRTCRLLTDANVAEQYLAPVLSATSMTRDQCRVIPPGEGQKSMASLGQVLDWLLETRMPRDGVLVALGGGVVGDLAGFAAAVYQRGIDFIQVPTTLLAQVDSSVGGKTGVNHERGKNMIGAFHQPRAVVADLGALGTLPTRELAAGVAEVVKYGLLGDLAFFEWLEKNLDKVMALDETALLHAVETCCAMKARLVAEDERESGVRALLNLGHTFGHAIENHTGYGNWLHGEAVAAGMCLAADLSARLGFISAEDAARCTALLQRAGLPVRPPPDLEPPRFLELMGGDKKVQDGKLRLVVLRRLGNAELMANVPVSALEETLRAGVAS